MFLRNGFEKPNFGLWDFRHNCQKGSALENLAGALPADGVGCTLSLVWEVKMEIPVNRSLP